MGRPEVDCVRIDRETGCWNWIQGGYGDEGYGAVYDPRKQVTVRAHRYIYEMLVGPIPEGLTIDHLCRNRRCVRPLHLEPVTRRENIQRGQARNVVANRTGVCQHGHSDWVRHKAQNRCRPCSRAYGRETMRRLRRRQKEAAHVSA